MINARGESVSSNSSAKEVSFHSGPLSEGRPLDTCCQRERLANDAISTDSFPLPALILVRRCNKRPYVTPRSNAELQRAHVDRSVVPYNEE